MWIRHAMLICNISLQKQAALFIPVVTAPETETALVTIGTDRDLYQAAVEVPVVCSVTAAGCVVNIYCRQAPALTHYTQFPD